MEILEIKSVEMDGALLYFKNDRHGLVREKEQPVTAEWVVGDRLELTVAESPVFRLLSRDTGEIAHILFYDSKNNEQILTLLDENAS